MTWWQALDLGLALGWVARSTVHWLGWIDRPETKRLGAEPDGDDTDSVAHG